MFKLSYTVRKIPIYLHGKSFTDTKLLEYLKVRLEKHGEVLCAMQGSWMLFLKSAKLEEEDEEC